LKGEVDLVNDRKRQRVEARPASILLCLLLALAPPLSAADWEPARILKGGGPETLASFPESASVVRRQLAAALEAHDGARIRAGLGVLADMGYAPSRETMDLLSPYLPNDERAALARRFAANRTPAGTSRLIAEVPADRRLIEGIARDPRNGRLFTGSVVGRELLVFEHGAWRAVAGVDGGSLFGMAVDAPRRLLWITSASLEQTPHPETAFRGLIALDLDSLRVARRVALTGTLGDLTVGPDGTIYASDSVGGAVFRLRPGDRAASVLVPEGRLRSPQGMVLSADGRRLYVADYAYGIGIVDPASGRVRRLAARRPAMLDGVDALLGDRGSLIAIQNGVNPHRIVRLRLDRAGETVIRVDVLERANPAWGEPSLGVIAGREMLYIADGQWERYGAGGAETGAARPTAIRSVRISVEAGLHRARGPRVVGADEGQRSRRGGRALDDRAGRRFFLSAGPRDDRFASHRTTFLTGFGTDHRVIGPPDECTMS
jgi:sugar lactone lactonase YvrE